MGPVMIGVVPLVTSDGRCETRSVGSEGTESSESSESSESAGGSAAYLAGKLLVATPAVEGDAFRRSVILMLHHDGEGAQGVVLNQPSEAAVDAVLPGWQAVATAPQTLFRGGPVGTDSAIGIVSVPGEGGKTLGVQRLFGGIGVVDLDAPPLLVAPEVAGLRIFAGYAGWSGGQLEGEIRRGDWYVVDAEPRDAFSDEPQELWESVLRRQRGNLAFVALYPDDPSMN
jgi:putative transcriptional regulator